MTEETPINPLHIPSASGIYRIVCTVTKKIYIGSATNLRKRRNEHFCELRQNKHGNSYLQHAWNKYGEQCFTFEVLEFVLPMSLTAREQYWFKTLKPFGNKGFNIQREAGSPLGTKHTPEQIEKIKQGNLGKKHSPEAIEKMRLSAIGRKFTPETIEKMRQAKIGTKPSHETREKMSQAAKNHSPESIERNRQFHLGRKHTPETRERFRQIGRERPPEAIEKMRQANLGRKKSHEEIEKTRQSKWSKRLEGTV